MSQVSWVRQLFLAVALFVLFTFAVWVEYKHKPQKESEEEQNKKVFQLSSTAVKSIRLTEGSKTFELGCLDVASKLCKSGDNSKWELSLPLKSKADDSNANNLLSALNNLAATEIIDLKEETPEKRAALLKEYGLDPAARESANSRKVILTTEAGTWTAYLGLTHPIGDGIFTLLAPASNGGKADENRVYLVPSYFKSNFDHDLTYWRNKKLLTVASHEIQSFTLESKKAGKIQASRKEGLWTLNVAGQDLAGDIENIDSLLAGAAFLSAKSFISENKGDEKGTAGLKGMQNILTLTLQKDKGNEKEAPAPIVLKLFEKTVSKKAPAQGQVIATVSNVDPLFELDLSAKDRLDKELKDLRLVKLITSMERFSAKKLAFSGKTLGAEPLVLINTGEKWQFEKTKAEANSEKVQALLEKLSGNRIKDFLPASAATGNSQDGVEVTLGDDKNPAKRRFLFWKKDGKLFARDLLAPASSKKDEILLVDTTVQDGLPWEAGFFKKSEPAPAKAEKSHSK